MEMNSKISSEEGKKKADGDISLEEKTDFESKKDDREDIIGKGK